MQNHVGIWQLYDFKSLSKLELGPPTVAEYVFGPAMEMPAQVNTRIYPIENCSNSTTSLNQTLRLTTVASIQTVVERGLMTSANASFTLPSTVAGSSANVFEGMLTVTHSLNESTTTSNEKTIEDTIILEKDGPPRTVTFVRLQTEMHFKKIPFRAKATYDGKVHFVASKKTGGAPVANVFDLSFLYQDADTRTFPLNGHVQLPAQKAFRRSDTDRKLTANELQQCLAALEKQSGLSWNMEQVSREFKDAP